MTGPVTTTSASKVLTQHLILTIDLRIEVPRDHRAGKTLKTISTRTNDSREATYCIMTGPCNGRAKRTKGGEHGGGGRERKDDDSKFEARITYASRPAKRDYPKSPEAST